MDTPGPSSFDKFLDNAKPVAKAIGKAALYTAGTAAAVGLGIWGERKLTHRAEEGAKSALGFTDIVGGATSLFSK